MLREHFVLDIMGMFMNTQKTLKSNKLSKERKKEKENIKWTPT